MERLYAFTPLWSETQSVYVSLGIPVSVAYAEANRTMARNLVFLVIATLLVGIGAWYLSELFLVKQTQALVNTTQRLASGELETRTRFPYHEGEMGMLAEAIDQMAQALEEREIERRQAEQALSEYALDLEHRNRELQDFANIASHDLQEPLRKIQIFSDLLIRRYIGELDDRACFYLQSMNESASRMQGLLRDLHSYSQVITRGKPFVRTDLVEIFQRVTKDLDYQIEKSEAKIEVNSLPVIEADPTQMYQLFQNLLSNSLKFHKPGQKPFIRIETKNIQRNATSVNKMTNDSKTCEILFKDEGIGFDEKYLDRIFQPFERLHSVGEYEGTGMGLAICRKIVERHGGAITAASIPGDGATFIIHLPYQQKEEGTHDY
jgi:light-regulated signal transduction histidine kinase (bacteriophytochrome)